MGEKTKKRRVKSRLTVTKKTIAQNHPSKRLPTTKSKTIKKSASSNKIDLILRKLDSIDSNQKAMARAQKEMKKEEDKIFSDEESTMSLEKNEIKEEQRIETEEKKIESETKNELDELKKIETLEANIKENLKESPLKRITYRDITKGIIGAFFGIVGHFAFVEGTHLAENYSYMRSIMLLVASFVIIVLFLYFSGFRKVNDNFVFQFLPIRAVVIYVSAIATVFVVLLLYGFIGAGSTFHSIFNTVAAISVLAVLGAGTADLIGKSE